MAVQHLSKECEPRGARNVREADESSVRTAFCEDESTEGLVHGDQDTVLFGRSPQDLPVARVAAPLADFIDFMAFVAQVGGQPPAGAAVDEEPQPAIRTGSRESLAITARA